jgi:hypothetical protein
LDGVDKLMSFFQFLLVPLVVHAGDNARLFHGRGGDCRSMAEKKERCGHGDEQLLEAHGGFLSCRG